MIVPHEELVQSHSTTAAPELIIAVDESQFSFQLVLVQQWVSLHGGVQCCFRELALVLLESVCLQQCSTDQMICEGKSVFCMAKDSVTNLKN